MKCLIIDNNSNTLQKLTSLLESFGVECLITNFGNVHDAPLDDFDIFILSGGNFMTNPTDASLYFEELNLIQNSTKPLLGIGVGFQLICNAFGCDISQRGERIQGIIDLDIVNKDQLFNNLNSNIQVSESHKFVVRKVNYDLEILANSIYGIEIVKHKKKMIYGFQFRPEILPDKTMGDELLKNFLNLAKKSSERSLFTKF